MISLRSFRSGGAVFVLAGLSVTVVYLCAIVLYQLLHPPRTALFATPRELEALTYNRLISLPLSAQMDLSYGPLSLPLRRQCHPFLFPRPTSLLYVTAWPNHGAGLGHQFGEWLYGPAIAMMLNVSYAHTGVLGNSARWDRWLGFGAGEDTEADVRNMAMRSRVVVRRDEEHFMRNNTLTIEDWVRAQLAEHHAHVNRSNGLLSARAWQQQPGEGEPPMEVTLLRIYRVHVPWPSRRYSCHPDINLLLRRKYCAARIRLPVPEDLYAADRAANRVVVAFHLRCGDSCYNPFRATPLSSVIRTIRVLADALRGAGLLSPALHLFSQPPHNDTAENHFRPVLESAELADISMVGHWYTHAHTTLHHLITADVLIGAQSSFSWVASLLHHTVALGPVDTCRWQVDGYDRITGEFDGQSLLRQLNASRKHAPRFRSMDDCYALRRWTDDLQPDEKGYNEI